MRTFFVSISLALLALVSVAHAEGACKGCADASNGRNQSVTRQYGGPVSDELCAYVAMPDPCDTAVVEAVDTDGNVTRIRDYVHKGAMVNTAAAGQFSLDKHGHQIVECTGREKAMVCFPSSSVKPDTSYIRVIPGDKGSCYKFDREALDDLREHGSWGPDREIHLGWAHTGESVAPVGFETLRDR